MTRYQKDQANQFPPGWDEERIRRVLEYYENQTEDEAVAEDEAGLDLDVDEDLERAGVETLKKPEDK